MAQPQGLERIPLAVGSDFQMPPVRVPERQGAGEWVNAGPPVGIDAPAQPSAPKEASISDTMSLLGQNIWDAVVYHTPAAMAAAVEGDEPYKTNDWKDWLIQRSRQRSAEMAGSAGDSDVKTAIPGVSKGDINSLGPSLGFSAVGAGAGLGAGVPAGIAGNIVAPGVGTAAGYAAGMLASGKAAYNMATNQFIRDLHDSVNEESVRVTGKPVSTQAFAEKQAELADVIRSYGLWEAAPEAAGNALSFGILTAPVKGAIGKLFGKNIATRMASKLGSLYGEELTTETVTQMGQHNAEVRAGMSRAPERSFTSPSDWAQSFKEVAPVTALQTTLMAGGFKGAHALLNRGRGAGTDDGADAVPGEDLGIGGSGGGGIEGEYIPADQSGPPVGPAGGRGGETFTQAPEPRQFARPALPAPAPLEGGVLGPESLPAGQALLPPGSIDSTATEVPDATPAPSLRQRATSRGLLKHSKRPSPELLMRLMRVDDATARMLYDEWTAAQTGPQEQDIATPRPHAGIPPVVQPTEGAKDGQRQTTAEVLSGAGEQSPAITPLEVQAHAAATSPFNARPQPTDAQKEAGNYAKGHIRFHGMDISIENPAGSVRSGTSADGKAWKTQMQHHYGYIRGTVGRDKDHLDVFIKPGAQSARTAYVIDQADPKTGAFDEHKIVFGADSEEDARAVYLSNYEKGWKGLGAMTAMPMDEFKAWLKSGKTKRPIAYKEPKGTVRATTKNDPEPHGQLSFGKVGLAPGIALPVSLKANNDGTATVMRGEEPFYDFDSGDPVKVTAGATPSQVKQAIIDAGAVTGKDKWFGVSDGAPSEPKDDLGAMFDDIMAEETGKATDVAQPPKTSPAKPVTAVAPRKNQEERTAGPVAESQAPAPSEPGEDGVAPIQGGAAPDREKDAKGNPIYKVGDRVEFVSGAYEGRHGAVKEANAVRMVSVMMFSNAPRTEETTYHYVVTTDNGAEFFASPSEIKFETSRPESVVPDISIDGIPQPPQRIYDGIGYAKQSAEKSRAAAQRARKASSIAEHKRYAQTADEKAARYQAAWDAWAKENPAEAEKIAPKPVAKPPGAAPSAGGSAAATVAGGALNVEGLLKGAGLVVTKTTTKNGTPVWNVSGNTREHIEAIKTIGGRWYGPRKVWSFYNDDPSTELAKKLEGKVKPAEPPKLTENEIILPDNPTYIYGKVGDQWHYKAVGAKYEGYAGTIGGDYALKLDAALKAKQSIAGKPTIAMSDASLENLANSTLASPAAQEKARAELAARDQADEVDLGALFDEVLDEERANASVKEEDSPVTQSHKVTHPDKMVNWWQNELSLSGRRQALNAVGSQAIRADVKWGYLPEKWQKALTEIVGTDKDPMVAEKAGASATAQKARWESYEVTMGADGRYLVREKTQSGYQNLASFKINAYGNSERVDHFFESEQTRAPVRKAIERFVQNQRTAGQAAASAVKNTASGLVDAIDGLGKLFGSNGSKLSSGLTFDEETYAKAKPLFASAIAHFKDAGADLKEAMRAVVRLVLEKFGPQVTENMKPYVVRFMEDVRGGKLNYDEGKEGQRNDRGAQVESGKPLADVSAGKVEGTEGGGPAGGRSDAGGDRGRGGNQGVDGQGRPPGRGRGDRAPAVDLPEADDGRPGRGNKGRTGADGSGVSERDGAGAGELTHAAIPEQNFVITEDVALGSGGQMTKYRDNIAAIKLIKTLQAERRRATPAEQRTLARYVGWGGIPNAFKNPITGEIKPDWKDEVAELESLLTPRELRDASSSTRNAHYTAQSVVDFMWRAAARMGFGGGLVLEPSAGTGNFIGRVPEFLRGNTFVTGIELDSITARIAGALYPRANIVHSGFEKLPIPDSTFDLAIGNPPFGKDILRFAYKPELNRATIHNQFFRASLDAVKPGGLQIMVVSRYLMDAQDTTNRLELAKEARLLGAVRLPGVAFKGNALTEVVTDILFLRRRTATEAGEMQQAIYEKGKPGPKNEPPKLAQARRDRAELLAEAMEWVETGKVKDPAGGSDIPINRYFIDNPQMIAGELNRSGSMRMQNDINVTLRDGETLEQAMDKAMEYLPGLKAATIADEAIAATEEAHRRLGEAMQLYATGAESGAMRFEDDGSVSKIIERIGEEQESVITKITLNKHTPWSPQLFMGLDGRWFRVEPKLDADGKKVKNGKRNVYERQYYASETDIPAALRLGESRFERIKQLLSIRDLLVKQLTLETTRAPVEQMESNRAELRAEYEAFVAAHGLISEPKNAGVVADMPDEGLLLSLESKYKPEVTAAKAARTGMKAAPAKATPSPILSRPVGIPPVRVDHADTISDALALTLSETGRLDVDHIATLRGISRDEAIKELTDGDSPLAYPDPEIGFALTEKNAYLSGNVRRKLEAARGANLAKNEAALQAVQPEPWTSDKVTPKFGGTWIPGAVYADFVSELLATKAHVTFAPLTNTFQVYADDTGAAARQVWGTERYPAPALMTTILNSRRIAVYDQDIEGNATLNQGATDAAMDKRRDILEAFDGWVFKDADRRGMLTKLFNDTYNVRVQRQHDGSHMTFPGKVPDEIISLRRGQINAIWRGIVERFVLYDHAVGAGKTFTGIARAMERRRMGLSKKPMVAVPNHLVKEWLIQSFRLYPGAKVLALGTNDLSAKARRRAFAKIATGDWDLVIVPHSSFKFINVSPETEERFLNQALEDANAALKEAEAESEGGRFKSLGVKAAEAMIASIQRRMDALRARSKDKLVTFEQMGIDDLTIDESHEFKNLGYSSNLEDVRGMGNKVGSSKAMDLYIKTRYLHESNGSIAFMTGTPISNSAAEMYTIMRYLAPDVLSEMGLDHFDAFRLQFVDATTAFEPTDSGSGLKAVTRLGRSWSNMRSLMDAYYSVADVVTNDDIQRWYAEDNPGKRFPLPKVKGGKRKEIVAKPTPTQQRILDQVVAGFNGLDAISDVKERNATRLRLMDRARKVALHAKVVNPQLEDEKGGKLDLAVAQIKRIYDAWTDDKGTQLVFLDRSIPKAKGDSTLIKEYDEAVAARDKALNEQNEADFIAANDRLEKFDSNEIEEMRRAQAGGWNAYQYIKDELVAAGIPSDEIAFIQNYTNETDKEALFGAVRDGSIRILLGSTPRMGAGTNVQERLVALHHIDVTWKPSDIEQREGRIIRQENQLLEKYGIDNFEVEILAYVTERTVDAKFWSLNATKLKMINGIRYYDGQFEMEFEDEDAVGMAEIAALASGDPLLLERFRLTAEVEALYRQKRSHQRRIEAAEDALLTAQRDQERLPARIIARQEQSVAAEAALRTADDAARQRTLTMLGNTYHAADADQAQFHLATEIKKQRGDDKNAPISIEINGKEYTTSGGAEEAITLILGDAQPFLAKVGGKPVIRRSDYARAMRAALGDVFKPTDGEIDVGEIFGMPATVEAEIDRWETPWITLRAKLTYGNGQVREIEERRNPRPQRHKSGDIIDITVQGLRPLISDIDKVLEYAANPEYAIQDMRKRIASAEKDIPLLEEQLKDRAFKRAEELAIKQERLREVEQQLKEQADSAGGAQPRDATAPTESRAVMPGAGRGATPMVADALKVVRRFLAEFVGAKALDIRVVANVADIPTQFRPSPYAEGVYHGGLGTVWLITSNMMRDGALNVGRLFQVLAHEVVGHYGLARMMGERFKPILAKVLGAAKAKGKVSEDIYQPGDADYATVEAVRLRYPEATDEEVAQEVMARMAESRSTRALFGYVRAKIRQWLRDLARAFGIDLDVTTAELNDLVTLASAYMRRGDNLPGEAVPGGVVAASKKTSPGETESKYSGPKYATIKALDEDKREVRASDGERIGTYPTVEMARKVKDSSEKTWMREYLKAQKTTDSPSILESRAASGGPRSPRDSSRGIMDPTLRKLGGELLSKITSATADRLVAFLGGITPEYIKAGVISDYGLEERYLDRQIERVAAENRAGRRVKSLVESLMLLDRAQSRVAYAWLNNRGEEADRLMEELPRDSRETLEEIKRWIAELTVEAVRLGQLDVETAARNFMAYLHRSYAKYDLNTDDKTWKAERARSIRTLGEQYKGRGLKINVDPDRIHSAPGWWDGEMKGKKVIVLRSRERRRVFGKMAYEWGFVAQGSPAPAKYADFVREGVWEIRARKADNAITLWRDFTPEERQSMGELDEAKYAVARTIFMMVHDIEIGRFHEWVAGEYAKTPEEAADEGLNVVEGEEMAGIAPRPYKLDEWARVPTTKVPGTNVFRYGAIAGMIVPGPIWNDIRQTGHGRYDPFGKTYSAIMRVWKLSKTALTPTTHINNVMANFIMADMHGVGGRDIIRAVSMMASAARGDPEAMGLWNRFEDSGATHGMFTTHELRREVLDPLLQQLREEVGMADGEPAVLRAVEILSMAFHGHIAESWGNAKAAIKASLPGRVASRLARKAQDYYQNEDAVFRFATFLKGVDDGFSDIEAGKRARKAFLDYHINAPWINAMRGTFLPFVAFVYRAAPMLAETAARKPWKIAKYMMVFGGLNALAYAMLGGDGDEDKERAYLPDEKAGKLWGMVPKLIRMPWNRSGTDKAGKPISDPVFLDVRRWIPVGDIVDFGQEQTAIPIIPPPLMPGGPAVMGMEFLANRSFFSGRNITLGTDTMTEKVGKVAEHFYKGFAPNIPGLPGTWATKKITDAYSGKTDPLGRAYDIPSAIASGVGLKVAPYPTETLRYNAAMEMRSQRGELNDEARRLRRDYSRGGMDRIDLEDKMKEIAEKKKNVAQGFKRKEAAAAGSDRQ